MRKIIKEEEEDLLLKWGEACGGRTRERWSEENLDSEICFRVLLIGNLRHWLSIP